jgi:two-component system LytT family response regulator
MEAVKKAEASMVKDELNIKYKTLLENVAAPARKKIVLKTSDRIYSVGTSEIIRFESEGSYTRVFLQEGKKIMVSRLIKEFDSLLSTAGFARVHQSHLINMEYLFCYEKQENHVVMKDNSIVPVAARKKDYLMELINAL